MAAIEVDSHRSTGMKRQYHKTARVQGVLLTQPLEQSWIQKNNTATYGSAKVHGTRVRQTAVTDRLELIRCHPVSECVDSTVRTLLLNDIYA